MAAHLDGGEAVLQRTLNPEVERRNGVIHVHREEGETVVGAAGTEVGHSQRHLHDLRRRDRDHCVQSEAEEEHRRAALFRILDGVDGQSLERERQVHVGRQRGRFLREFGFLRVGGEGREVHGREKGSEIRVLEKTHVALQEGEERIEEREDVGGGQDGELSEVHGERHVLDHVARRICVRNRSVRQVAQPHILHVQNDAQRRRVPVAQSEKRLVLLDERGLRSRVAHVDRPQRGSDGYHRALDGHEGSQVREVQTKQRFGSRAVSSHGHAVVCAFVASRASQPLDNDATELHVDVDADRVVFDDRGAPLKVVQLGSKRVDRGGGVGTLDGSGLLVLKRGHSSSTHLMLFRRRQGLDHLTREETRSLLERLEQERRDVDDLLFCDRDEQGRHLHVNTDFLGENNAHAHVCLPDVGQLALADDGCEVQTESNTERRRLLAVRHEEVCQGKAHAIIRFGASRNEDLNASELHVQGRERWLRIGRSRQLGCVVRFAMRLVRRERQEEGQELHDFVQRQIVDHLVHPPHMGDNPQRGNDTLNRKRGVVSGSQYCVRNQIHVNGDEALRVRVVNRQNRAIPTRAFREVLQIEVCERQLERHCGRRHRNLSLHSLQAHGQQGGVTLGVERETNAIETSVEVENGAGLWGFVFNGKSVAVFNGRGWIVFNRRSLVVFNGSSFALSTIRTRRQRQNELHKTLHKQRQNRHANGSNRNRHLRTGRLIARMKLKSHLRPHKTRGIAHHALLTRQRRCGQQEARSSLQVTRHTVLNRQLAQGHGSFHTLSNTAR